MYSAIRTSMSVAGSSTTATLAVSSSSLLSNSDHPLYFHQNDPPAQAQKLPNFLNPTTLSNQSQITSSFFKSSALLSPVTKLDNSSSSAFGFTHNSNNWLDSQAPPNGLTIINESDFPSLGVRWSPSSFGVSSHTTDGSAAQNITNVGISSYGSVARASPAMVGPGGLLSSPHHHALFNRGGDIGHNAVIGRPYANLIRDGSALSAANEFRIQNEDFPALPGAMNNKADPTTELGNFTTDQQQRYAGGMETIAANTAPMSTSSDSVKPGIQTHADGLVTNIPPDMLNDQYGMAGLLTFLRTIESDPSIVALALGHDLTNLGLNLNSSKRNLYQTFGGPWAPAPCRIQDLDVKVPEEYLTNATIRDKLPNIKLNKLTEDVLFYLFYNCPGEVYQVAAASELYQRDWRFHKQERVWLTKTTYASHPNPANGASSYYVFDPVQWRKIPREMILDQKHLEGKPSAHLNAMNNNSGNTASTSANNGNTAGLTSTPMGPSAGAPSLGGMGIAGVPDHQDLTRK
ncbi:NOT2 / NOT3 / NOT5 family domain-containing protein [Ditylenchus destructor]|uniref:NOT2 / NOT3 / NOT5 family domain-containing protein n=1 Tax=Ditylenchus destructor TaxID=166010 RepID=A0AAD4NFW2_9BILA|nr:NOT2 / NOT3 / NOT5 family domain-containing protein [Ditylenchus destructor]